jgi:DNA-binding IclR family transcriptional regulator
MAPLHATGVGKVILAFSEPDLLASLVQGRLQRCTPYTISTPELLIQSVNQTRESQLGFSIQEMAIGRCSVAAPIFGGDDRLIGSLAVVARSSTDVNRLAPAVLAAAAKVTRNLPDRLSPADQTAELPPVN